MALMKYWLDIEQNAGNSERSVIFGTFSSHLLLTQKPRFGNIQVELPDDRNFTLCPGVRVNFPIHSTINIPYRVYRANANSSADEVITTFQGVGGTYNFLRY